MKKLILKILSRSKSSTLSFAAKSTLIGFGAISANGAFASGSPSWITLITKSRNAAMKSEQLSVVQSLVTQKLESPDLPQDEKDELLQILSQLNEPERANENASTEN